MVIILIIMFTLLLVPVTKVSAATGPAPNSWLLMIIGLIGGLAFFLYGMEKMSTGLKQSTGDQMRTILAALTKNSLIGLLAGAFVTTVIQSSSATTVMVISFVQSQLMTFSQSLGVVLGANIGTTITAQMVAFKLTDLALIMVAIGFGMHMFGKSHKVKCIGDIILGFGILFYGMKLMSDAMKPLRTSAEFIELMQGLEQPIIGLAVGMLFTALVQSSSASIGVVIVLAQQGLVSLEAGIPIILGANIGTCITAGLASIGTSRNAKRVALAYVIFEVIGVLAFLFWIPQFADLVRVLTDISGSGTARQIANAHTVFNVTLGLVFLPFVGVFAKLITAILPDKKIEQGVIPAVWHLDDSMISTPALAIELVHAEIARMAKIVYRMHRAVIYPFVSKKKHHDTIYPHLSLLDGIEMREQKINFLEKKIRDYLIRISRNELTRKQATEINCLIALLDSLEGIGDIIIKFIVPLIDKKQELKQDFSREGKRELIIYHRRVGHQLLRLQEVMMTLAYSLAKKVKIRRHRHAELDAKFRQAHMERLFAERAQSLETHTVHMELMDAIKTINIYAAEIADQLINSGILTTDTLNPDDQHDGEQ